MATFILLTKIDTHAIESPDTFKKLEKRVVDEIKRECRQVHWIKNLAVLGPYDFLDLFEAPDIDEAMKVATIIRAHGHAQTEVWAAKEWARFKELVDDLNEKAAA